VEISGLPSSILITERQTGIGIAFIRDYEITGLDSANGTHFVDLPTKPGGCLVDAELFEGFGTAGSITAAGTRYTYDNLSACNLSGTQAISQTRSLSLAVTMLGDQIGVQFFNALFASDLIGNPRFNGCQVMICEDGFDSSVEYDAPLGFNSGTGISDKRCSDGDIWFRFNGQVPGVVECGFAMTESTVTAVGTIKASLV
jgi:hypothetical protein